MDVETKQDEEDSFSSSLHLRGLGKGGEERGRDSGDYPGTPPAPSQRPLLQGGPLRSPHQGVWALGRGLGAAAPEAARPLPPLPPGPGWGSESRSPPGARLLRRAPSHPRTQRQHARTGARAAALPGAAVRTHTRALRDGGRPG